MKHHVQSDLAVVLALDPGIRSPHFTNEETEASRRKNR